MFQVKESADLSAFDFKIQTDTIFAQAEKSNFVVKTDSDQTEIITFEESRLEATSLEDPERIIFMSEYQRLATGNELATPTIENLSPSEAGAMKAEFQLKPQGDLFDSSPDKYRTDLQQKSSAESTEIVDDDSINEP